MPPDYLAPGVYAQEIASGIRTVSEVATSNHRLRPPHAHRSDRQAYVSEMKSLSAPVERLSPLTAQTWSRSNSEPGCARRSRIPTPRAADELPNAPS